MIGTYIAAYLHARFIEGWEAHVARRYASNAVKQARRQRIERFGRI